MGTSADALVALASLSSQKQPEAVSEEPANGKPESATTSSYSYGAHDSSNHYGASHGFGAGLPTPSTVKRGIPSYATIHGQGNGESASTSFIVSSSTSNPTNGRGTTSYLSQLRHDDNSNSQSAGAFYSERYYNPVTGKEYTTEETARFQQS
jgi:hypothetical protein